MTELNKTNEKKLSLLIGKTITIFCCRYFYCGELVTYDDFSLILKNPKIIYETGKYTEKNWETAESLEVEKWNVTLASIESFGILNKS